MAQTLNRAVVPRQMTSSAPGQPRGSTGNNDYLSLPLYELFGPIGVGDK
jgi:hypothetical protein